MSNRKASVQEEQPSPRSVHDFEAYPPSRRTIAGLGKDAVLGRMPLESLYWIFALPMGLAFIAWEFFGPRGSWWEAATTVVMSAAFIFFGVCYWQCAFNGESKLNGVLIRICTAGAMIGGLVIMAVSWTQ